MEPESQPSQKGPIRKFLSPLGNPLIVASIIAGSFIFAAVMGNLPELKFTARSNAPSPQPPAMASPGPAAKDGLDAQVIIRRNSFEALVLGSEMKREFGPHFSIEAQVHSSALERLIARMDSRLPSNIDSKFSARLQLAPALRLMKAHESSDAESRPAIAEAASIIVQVSKDWSGQPTYAGQFGTENPVESANAVRESIAEFSKATDSFQKQPTIDNATTACMQSRLAYEAAADFWQEFTHNQKNAEIEAFVKNMTSLGSHMSAYGLQLSGGDRERIADYAGNIDHRAKVLASMNTGNVPETIGLLVADSKR